MAGVQVAYQVRIYDTTGVLKFVLALRTDVRTIVIEHRVNYPSTLTLGLSAFCEAIQYLEQLDALIEVRRRVPQASLEWYTEYIGFHRTPQDEITEADSQIYYSYSRGLLDLIKRRSIRYYADTAGANKGPAPADDIIKEYVYENAGAGAVAGASPLRLSDGVTAGLTVAADTSEAATIETGYPWNNLLDAIRSIGEPNFVDFEVVWGGESDPLAFEFRTYYPQLGTDRRAGTANPFIFAPNLQNMMTPTLTKSRTDEITSVLVLGPGESVSRDTLLVVSDHSTASPWNLIELDVDASQEDRADAQQAIADKTLYDKRPATSFNFAPLQTPSSTYAKHYFMGDLVTGAFKVGNRELQADVKIRALTITVNHEAGESLNLELEEVPEGV